MFIQQRDATAADPK